MVIIAVFGAYVALNIAAARAGHLVAPQSLDKGRAALVALSNQGGRHGLFYLVSR